MASPITTLGAATIGPSASVTTPGAEMVMNGPTQPPAPPAPPASATPGTSGGLQPPTSDTVELSPKALDLSKALTNRKLAEGQQENDKQPALDDQQVQRKLAEPVIQKPTDKPDLSLTKQYPPFMGNSEELKLLRSQAPALYRQLLRMIVPPPVNISYTDAQLLQRPSIDARM